MVMHRDLWTAPGILPLVSKAIILLLHQIERLLLSAY